MVLVLNLTLTSTMPKKNNKTKKQPQSSPNIQKNRNDSMKVMDADSSVALQFTIRHPKKEKGIIVSDSDWDDIKASNQKLKDVSNAFYTWSGVCFSTAVTLMITIITLWSDKKEQVIQYLPFYIMFVIFVVSIIIGILLIVKGKGKASTIESAIDSLETVINRIERKTSGLENINYYGSQSGDNL